MSVSRDNLSRRQFLTQTGRGAAALSIGISANGLNIQPVHAETPRSPKRPQSKNNTITLALIGCGGMGTANMYNLMAKPDVEVAALCDVDERRFPHHLNVIEKKYGKRPDAYTDFRKLLERKDINAVIVATPDHWHALPVITACEAGKDIYCEKPISHDITEGRAMVAAAKKFNRVVQVGTWQRSTREFVSAIAAVRSGLLGPITTVRAWKTDEFRVGHNAKSAPPTGLDYNFWLGPAARQEYKYLNNDCHFNWRWYLNFGSGMTGDWGVHMMDIALLGMSKGTDLVMPTEVSAFGGKLAFPDDERTAPDTQIALMKFSDPNFVLHWETGRKPVDNGPDHGTEFIAADGTSLMVWRGGWVVRDRDGKFLPKQDVEVATDHWQNWLDCIRSREQPRSHIESMYQTTAVCHLANAALLANETVRWDKVKDDIVGRAGKNTQSYYREYRKPWTLPIYKA